MKWFIPAITTILASLSLITLRSIAPDLASRQLLFFVIGSLVFLLAARVRFKTWQQLSPIGYFLLNLTLLALLIIGQTTRGVTSWIDLFGGYKLQPSQFALVITALFLSTKLDTLKTSNWLGLLQWLGLILVPTSLIFLEPDFGTGVVLLVSLAASLLLVPVKFKHLLVLAGIGVFMSFLAWTVILKPYQKQRITSFMGGYQDQEDSATYNARQALIAVGSGQMYGRGLGFGVQSHLKFLPERQTDFIFASIAEEWGFVGSLLLVSLYFVVVLLLIKFCLLIDDAGQRLYLLTLLVMIFVQVVINIGMNLGLLPITGITLPLISYGGSSIVSFMFLLGLAFQVADNIEPQAKLEIS